jgi:hypothetical protein
MFENSTFDIDYYIEIKDKYLVFETDKYEIHQDKVMVEFIIDYNDKFKHTRILAHEDKILEFLNEEHTTQVRKIKLDKYVINKI